MLTMGSGHPMQLATAACLREMFCYITPLSQPVAPFLLQTHTYLSTQQLAAGTASYMAPECFAGGSVGEKADMYSLGCMLLECITGERPWKGLNVVQVANQVRYCWGEHFSSPCCFAGGLSLVGVGCH